MQKQSDAGCNNAIKSVLTSLGIVMLSDKDGGNRLYAQLFEGGDSWRRVPFETSID